LEVTEFVVDRVHLPESADLSSIVYLKEKNGDRELPILIGLSEAQSIMMVLQGIKSPRPMTHDLIVSLIKAFGLEVERIVINDLKDNTYYARIILSDESKNTMYSIDARPSDSIAIALRVRAPIFISEYVLKKALYLEENR